METQQGDRGVGQPQAPTGGQMGGPGYYGQPGYGMGWGRGRPPRMFPLETKPFFLTSEFAAYAVATIAWIITAAVDNGVGSWRFWILETVLTSVYMLSRGIAKSGTKSRSWDPREELMARAREGKEQGN